MYNNRQQAKFQKIKHSYKGTSTGIEKSIFDQLIRYVSGETLINYVLPSKEDITRHSRTRIIEKYDITQNYFDSQYMYTSGGEYITQLGDSYIGYYHVQLLDDGRKQLLAGKCGEHAESNISLSPVNIGYIYNSSC